MNRFEAFAWYETLLVKILCLLISWPGDPSGWKLFNTS